MSRHSIPAHQRFHRVTVGWDFPLLTFFAQVRDTRIDEDKGDQLVLWVGADAPWIEEPEGLREPLAPFCALSDATIALLRAERDADAAEIAKRKARLDRPPENALDALKQAIRKGTP